MANDYKYHMDHHASVVRPPGYETDLDHAVDEAILRQRRLGLLALSDGELRRRNDLAVLYDAVDGFGEPTGPGPLAELVGSGHAAEVRPIVAAPTLRGRLTGAESTRLGQVEERGTMIALPAPGYVAALAGDPTYGTALAEIVREELVAINADGVPFAILRNPAIGFLLTVDGRARAVELGIDPDKTVTSMLEADNAVVDGLAGRVDDTFRVSLDVTTAGTATGGYDRAAVEDFLERQGFGRICVEQPIDPARRFPLDLVPSGLVVSLGVIDVSSPELEDVDEVVGRIDEAAEVLDIDDIAVATNGGFHAVSGIPADVGHAKLQRVEMVARYFWGNEL